MKKLNLLTFEEARELARPLKLKSSTEWKNYCKHEKTNKNIPASPYIAYRNKGWTSWGDFLGTNNISNTTKNKSFRSFEEAKIFARSLNLKNSLDWAKYAKSGKRPTDIPSAPYNVYKDKGWVSWGDWLGDNTVFLSFELAREFVRSLRLNDTYEWFDYAKNEKRPHNIPGSPANYYRDSGWVSWYDWLGKDHSRKKTYRPFNEAKEFVRSLGLKTTGEWIQYCKSGNRPNDIPSAPNVIYKNKGWGSIKDWLGTAGANSSKYRPFEQAREFVRSLGIENHTAWALYSKSGNRPKDIPSSPCTVYKHLGWISWKDWIRA